MPAPPLNELLRHAAELPPAFSGDAHLPAVVADLFDTLYGQAPDRGVLDALRAATKRHRGWVLGAAWVAWHPALRAAPPQRPALQRLLTTELSGVSAVADPAGLATDAELREELVRRYLRAAGAVPSGETETEAADRLGQVDSVERHRVLKAAAEREKRAREVREAMAKKAAEEAAAKVTRE